MNEYKGCPGEEEKKASHNARGLREKQKEQEELYLVSWTERSNQRTTLPGDREHKVDGRRKEKATRLNGGRW